MIDIKVLKEQLHRIHICAHSGQLGEVDDAVNTISAMVEEEKPKPKKVRSRA